MNFDFSDEQKQFGEQVKRLLGKTAPLSEARRALDGDIAYSQPAWQGLAELGCQAIMIPEEYGGLGFGVLELCVAAEQIGRALAPLPSLSSIYICTEAIRLFGTPAQKKRLLPGLADGSVIGTWAATERPQELRPENIDAKFHDGRLSGKKLPVLDGMAAHICIVMAKNGNDDIILTICDLSDERIRRQNIENVDPSRPVAELIFDQAPAEELGHAGWNEWEMLQNRVAVLLAFEQVGAADRALYQARDYSLGRITFGRPIGTYQAIKHKLADVYAKNQIARSHAYYGAWALASDAPELQLAAAGARAASTEALTYAAQENLQTHGGIGYTWESDCQIFYRRARQYALILGPVKIWKERIMHCLNGNDYRSS